MSVPTTLTRLARPVTVVGAAAALAFGLAAPASADTGFPLEASSALVGLSLYGGDSSLDGVWGAVSVNSEAGADYPSADFSADPDGIGDFFAIGGQPESRVNTTKAGNGRSEAKSALSGGFTLDLPGYDEPAVRFATLQNSIKCDFSGSLVWENKVNGGPGENDGVITVFGTPITTEAPQVSATVDIPGRGSTADVTIERHEPSDASAGRGRVYTTVSVTEDGDPLFDLTLGAVAVDCDNTEEEAPGEDEPGEEQTPGGEEPGEEETPGGEEPEDEETETDEDSPAETDEPEEGEEDEPKDTDESLPVTGGALASLVAAGALALGGGGAALYYGRRRKAEAAEAAED